MALPNLPQQLLRDLHEKMFLIRAVEERIKVEYASRRIRGPVHLSIGQEAAAVGVLHACRQSDVCVSTHRNHAHYLAKGGSLAGMVDELFGLDTGCCKGYGGSMHLMDLNANLILSSAILAGSIPIASGIAFALKNEGTKRVCIGFLGDGATDEGVFFETLNLAALMKLPLLFVVENNAISTMTTFSKRQAVPDVVGKAERFGVRGMTVDGNDVLSVYDAAQDILQGMRQTHEPFVLETVTDRLCAHVGPIVYPSGIGADDTLQSRWMREPMLILNEKLRSEFPDQLDASLARERNLRESVDQVFIRGAQRFDADALRLQLPAAPPAQDVRRV